MPSNEHIHVAIPFTVAELGMDFYKNWQMEALRDFYIKAGIRSRHNHMQLDIVGYTGIDGEDILCVLTEVLAHAQDMGFALEHAKFRAASAAVWRR